MIIDFAIVVAITLATALTHASPYIRFTNFPFLWHGISAVFTGAAWSMLVGLLSLVKINAYSTHQSRRTFAFGMAQWEHMSLSTMANTLSCR